MQAEKLSFCSRQTNKRTSAMHATQLLDKPIRKQCQDMHRMRWNALMDITTALIHGKKLTVTGLGRAIASPAFEKHNIKRADRLIGNLHLKNRWTGYLSHDSRFA